MILLVGHCECLMGLLVSFHFFELFVYLCIIIIIIVIFFP